MENLIPNCSEATFRIDISNLNAKEIAMVKKVWDAGVKEYEKENDWDAEGEGGDLYEETIFGIKCLKSKGDFPFNGADKVKEIVKNAEEALGKKLRTDEEEQ